MGSSTSGWLGHPGPLPTAGTATFVIFSGGWDSWHSSGKGGNDSNVSPLS